MNKLLNPKIDYVFKRIFSHDGSEDVTKDLLESVIQRKISNLELNKNPILEKDLADDKVGILDIRAKIDGSINCNIEMQVANRKDIEKRLLFYWGEIYTKSISSGEEYAELEKTIAILFIDFELENLKEIPKYMTKWNIREEEYSKVILTDVMEIYIIEMPKFKKYQAKGSTLLNSWIKFINNPEVIDMSEENKEIKKAREILEEISADEHERALAEYREKYIRDQKASESFGYDRGLKEGMEQGKAEEKKEMIKAMYKKGIDLDTICEISNLTPNEIQKILADQ